MTLRSLLLGGVLAAGLVLVPATAWADPAGPTDFRTEVTSVEPPTDKVEVSIEGGDAFVRIVVQPGHEVVVLGYGGEPYIRVNSTGVVEENQRSPATFYNEERYGAEVPADVTTEGALEPPDWQQVGTNGVWAWHDHRSHLMSPEPLIGMKPGDALAPEAIELLVDGEPVTVEVVTTLQPAPAGWATLAGLIVGLVAAAVVLINARRAAVSVMVALGVALVAVVVGAAQFLSLPAETGPLVTWWLLPGLALVASAAAAFLHAPLWRGALLALAGLQLLLWAVPRRDVLTRAILPTDLPAWVDRLATAAVIPTATAIVLVGAATMFPSTTK